MIYCIFYMLSTHGPPFFHSDTSIPYDSTATHRSSPVSGFSRHSFHRDPAASIVLYIELECVWSSSPLSLAGNPRTQWKQNGNDASYGDPGLILSHWLPDPNANLSPCAVCWVLEYIERHESDRLRIKMLWLCLQKYCQNETGQWNKNIKNDLIFKCTASTILVWKQQKSSLM